MPSSPANPAPVRVLIVDGDRAVRTLLARELGASGYEVDTLSSGDGFTEDMVDLVRPDVLLVDPFLGDVPLPAVENLLARLRAKSDLILLLMDAGKNPVEFRRIAELCRADGQIAKKELLRAPADAFGDQLVLETELEEMVSEEGIEEDLLPSAEMVAETGEEIELEPVLLLERRPVPRPATPSNPPTRSAPHRSSSRPNLLAMIEEELGERPLIVEAPSLPVPLTLFSRNNFYVGSSGDLATGGVFVATALLPKVGDQMKIRLEFERGGPLETEGRVEFVRQSSQMGRVLPGAGISLAHLDLEQRKRLEKFFTERAPLTYLPNRR